jgi:heat shock protein HtpX
MAIAKRVFLFLALNFAVVIFISFLLYIFNIQPFLTQHGINPAALAVFCLIWGMGGAMISLFLSKTMAKWMMGVKIIDASSSDPNSKELLDIVHTLASKAGLPGMPEVGIYDSPEVNAFATGASKSKALVAVSTGLLRRLNREQVEGVLGHEITHVANGDMVTMALLQGVINAFVMFFARIIAYVISGWISAGREDERGGSSLMYYGIVFALEMVFMVLGSLIVASFSRRREFRADFGGARLSSPENMISALNALKRTIEIQDEKTAQPAFQAFKISSKGGLLSLFASHPPLDDRIVSLKTHYSIL